MYFSIRDANRLRSSSLQMRQSFTAGRNFFIVICSKYTSSAPAFISFSAKKSQLFACHIINICGKLRYRVYAVSIRRICAALCGLPEKRPYAVRPFFEIFSFPYRNRFFRTFIAGIVSKQSPKYFRSAAPVGVQSSPLTCPL